MAWIGAIIAGAISGAGAFAAHKTESKRAKRKKKALLKNISLQKGIGGSAFDQQEAAVRRATEKRLGGLSTAEKDISRALRDRESVAQGKASQLLSRSGLGSTSIGVNAQRAVTKDTSSQMSDLLSRLAEARSEIEANREEALGSIAGQRAQLQSGLAEQATLGKVGLDYEGPSLAEGLVGAAGAGFGAYLGAGGNFGMGNQQAQQQSLLDQIYRGGFGQSRIPTYGTGLGGQFTIPQSFGGYY